jgi:hypothetical protein
MRKNTRTRNNDVIATSHGCMDNYYIDSTTPALFFGKRRITTTCPSLGCASSWLPPPLTQRNSLPLLIRVRRAPRTAWNSPSSLIDDAYVKATLYRLRLCREVLSYARTLTPETLQAKANSTKKMKRPLPNSDRMQLSPVEVSRCPLWVTCGRRPGKNIVR